MDDDAGNVPLPVRAVSDLAGALAVAAQEHVPSLVATSIEAQLLRKALDGITAARSGNPVAATVARTRRRLSKSMGSPWIACASERAQSGRSGRA